MRALSLALPLAVALAACDSSDDPGIPYDLSQPDTVLVLDEELREISGLTWLVGGRLVAVQDEDGELFELDPETGAVFRQRRFFNDGDYEGIEQANGVMWIVESDGDLYRYSGSGEAERIETGLERANEVEGLAYDASRRHLLLACKEEPGAGLAGVRAVYAYDLDAEDLLPSPVYTLDREALDVGDDLFKPSGLAVHPESREIYVLSSAREALAVLTPEGALRTSVSLPSGLFPDPEGIAFAPDGTLYVSNEGADGLATLLRFSPGE